MENKHVYNELAQAAMTRAKNSILNGGTPEQAR